MSALTSPLPVEHPNASEPLRLPTDYTAPSFPNAVVPEMLVTTYLEMTRRIAFRPEYTAGDHFNIQRMARIDLPFYRFLYSTVGDMWRWRDRTHMPDEELEASLKNTIIDILYVDGIPGGYIELLPQDTDTEIAYFGLRPQFFGMGLGKHLLSYGIAQAWSYGAKRVWLHTCNLDGPHALENYLKRGFTIFNVTEEPLPAEYL